MFVKPGGWLNIGQKCLGDELRVFAGAVGQV